MENIVFFVLLLLALGVFAFARKSVKGQFLKWYLYFLSFGLLVGSVVFRIMFFRMVN